MKPKKHFKPMNILTVLIGVTLVLSVVNLYGIFSLNDRFGSITGAVVDTGNQQPTYKQWAADLGLDTNKFNSCFDSGKYKSEVQQDFSDGAAIGVSGTPSFFIGNDEIGYHQVVGAQPYSRFQQIIDQLLQPTNQGLQPLQVQYITDITDNDPVKGSEDAPITIVEFSDFECPFCGRFFSQTLPLIEDNYIDTGKVKFVYRDFPLSFHPQAQPAAEAAECANEQGKFWDYHDKIFNNQGALSTAS